MICPLMHVISNYYVYLVSISWMLLIVPKDWSRAVPEDPTRSIHILGIARQPNVALLSPLGTPRIAHEPVILSSIRGAVPHDQDTMIAFGATRIVNALYEDTKQKGVSALCDSS
jgi:hypothetical protein